MALNILDFLGGGKAQTHLRGTDHENVVFGLQNSEFLNGVPKLKFEHFIKFNLFTNIEFDKKNLSAIAALVKSADYPSMSIDTATLNQYNKKRVIQKKIEFNKITVTIHDVADGLTLDFWKKYYQYTFKDGSVENKLRNTMLPNNKSNKVVNKTDSSESSTIITKDDQTRYYDNYGLTARTNPFFESIEIYYSHGKLYDKVILLKPKISDFKHDQMNYEDGTGMMSLTFTFEYENVIYGNILPFNDTEATQDVPNRLSHTLTRSNKTGEPKSRVSSAGLSINGDSSSTSDPFGIQKTFGGLLGNIGNDISSSIVRGLTTGDFSLKPNPLKAAKNSIVNKFKNAGDSALQNFVAGSVNAVEDSVKEAIAKAEAEQQAKDQDDPRKG